LSEVGVNDACTLTGLLAEGNSRRCTARLGDHSHSSRSHSVFTLALQVPGRQHPFSKFHLVDLAGSERAASGGSRQRKEEGANINKSLVTLGNVISSLGKSDYFLIIFLIVFEEVFDFWDLQKFSHLVSEINF
jgi:Kinesin motor domain